MKVFLKIIFMCSLYLVLFLLYYFGISLVIMIPVSIIDGWESQMWLIVSIASFFTSLILSFITLRQLTNF